MSRSHLLNHSLRQSPRPAPRTPGVWAMALTVIGAAFGLTRRLGR